MKKKLLILLSCSLAIFFFSQPAFTAAKTATKPHVVKESRWIFGESWQKQPLWAHSFGSGKNVTLYLGGTHAGIERGAVNITNSWLSYLKAHKSLISKKHKVIVIPLLNPDGYANYTRENAHHIDLNRNFSVNWQMWGNLWSVKIYAGPKPFSEHESIALKNLVQREFNKKRVKTAKLISYHMGTNQVFAPNIDGRTDINSLKFAKFYNHFASYPGNYTFDYYKLTGEITAWAAKTFSARAITVEMGAMEEFNKNKRAMEEVIKY